jgi:hypothetical protein
LQDEWKWVVVAAHYRIVDRNWIGIDIIDIEWRMVIVDSTGLGAEMRSLLRAS